MITGPRGTLTLSLCSGGTIGGAAPSVAAARRFGCDRVDVLGVSWGGGLAQQYAFQYPQHCLHRHRGGHLAIVSEPDLLAPQPRVNVSNATYSRLTRGDKLRCEAPVGQGVRAMTAIAVPEGGGCHLHQVPADLRSWLSGDEPRRAPEPVERLSCM